MQEISRTQGNLNENLPTNAYFGISIARLGDINGDGINDIAVSSNEPKIYILRLDTNGTVKSKTIIAGNMGGMGSAGAGFGTDLASLGDMDNDGYPELVTTDYYSKTVYFLMLNSTGTVKYYTSYVGTINYFGTSVCNLGDIDNDNIPDIAVGAMYDNSVTILRLNSNFSIKGSTKIANNSGGFPNILYANDWFGIEVENAGDLDGDGINDLMVGASQDDNGASSNADYGAVYVIFLNSNGTVKNFRKISRTSEASFYNVLNTVDKMGGSVARMSQNSNGTIRFIVSAHFSDDGGTDRGAIYLMDINKSFNMSLTPTHVSCFGQCNGTVTANVNGGTPPFTYLWSNNATSQSLSNVCAGTYSLTITAANNATIVQSTTVNQPPELIVHASNDTIICLGQSVSLTANATGGAPPLFYFWNQGLGMGQNKTVSPGSSTSYIVYALDINGCTSNPDTINVSVQSYQQANIFGLSSSYCANDTASTLMATPAAGSFSGPGMTGPVFSPTLAGAGQHTITYNVPGGCVSPAQVQITVHPVPQLTISGLASSYCSNSAMTSLIGTPAGGTFSGNGISLNSFSPSAAGQGNHNITYNYTSVNGCSNTSTVTTSVSIAPQASAGSNMSIQPGTGATLLGSATAGSGMYSYSWAPADSFFFPNVQAPTTKPLFTTNIFTLTVTDLQTQCQASAQVIVTVQSSSISATVTANPAVSCYGAPVQLNVVPGGGTGNYTYSWSSIPAGFSSSLPNPVVNPVISTTYTVTVTSGALTTTAITLVNVHPYSPAAFMAFPSQLCNNAAAITLQASPAGGSFVGPGVASGIFNPAIAGTGVHSIIYSLTDSNGCIAADTAYINILPSPVTGFSGLPLSVCKSDLPYTLTGIPAGGSFAGNGISGNIFSPAAVSAGQNLVSYSFTAMNGCTSTAFQAVNVKNSPLASAGNDHTIACGGSGIQIGSQALAGLGYAWAPTTGLSNAMLSNPVANPPHTVQYVLYVTDLNNLCTSTDTIIITLSGTPAITVSNDTAVCAGSMLSLQASGANQYAWSNGDSTAVILVQPLSSTYYVVQAYNNPQCNTIDTVFVEVLTPKAVFLGNDTSITEHQSITLDAGAGFTNYLWSNNATSQSITITGNTLGTGTHSIRVIVTDSNGCMNADTLQLMVTVGMNEAVSENSIKVYPNPFSDEIIISLAGNYREKVELRLMSIDSRNILHHTFNSKDDGSISLQLGFLSSGIYLLEIKTQKETNIFKLIK